MSASLEQGQAGGQGHKSNSRESSLSGDAGTGLRGGKVSMGCNGVEATHRVFQTGSSCNSCGQWKRQVGGDDRVGDSHPKLRGVKARPPPTTVPGVKK